MHPGEERISFKKTLLIGVSIGIISGFGTLLFFTALEYCINLIMGIFYGGAFPTPGQSCTGITCWTPPPIIWLILPIICGGALLSGLIVYKFAPEAEGHGTDAALKAYHGDGKIRWRVPFVKAVASLITISTGAVPDAKVLLPRSLQDLAQLSLMFFSFRRVNEKSRSRQESGQVSVRFLRLPWEEPCWQQRSSILGTLMPMF